MISNRLVKRKFIINHRQNVKHGILSSDYMKCVYGGEENFESERLGTEKAE